MLLRHNFSWNIINFSLYVRVSLFHSISLFLSPSPCCSLPLLSEQGNNKRSRICTCFAVWSSLMSFSGLWMSQEEQVREREKTLREQHHEKSVFQRGYSLLPLRKSEIFCHFAHLPEYSCQILRILWYAKQFFISEERVVGKILNYFFSYFSWLLSKFHRQIKPSFTLREFFQYWLSLF